MRIDFASNDSIREVALANVIVTFLLWYKNAVWPDARHKNTPIVSPKTLSFPAPAFAFTIFSRLLC